jgi:hypothetical protein
VELILSPSISKFASCVVAGGVFIAAARLFLSPCKIGSDCSGWKPAAERLSCEASRSSCRNLKRSSCSNPGATHGGHLWKHPSRESKMRGAFPRTCITPRPHVCNRISRPRIAGAPPNGRRGRRETDSARARTEEGVRRSRNHLAPPALQRSHRKEEEKIHSMPLKSIIISLLPSKIRSFLHCYQF